ncbi:MAG: GAF domain-containing protein [Anaerolineae bacterium]|nr:GAF domain-containing protein [Anaerolineae bacterium]
MMHNMALPHNHNSWVVLLSIIIAILASYTALDLAGRVTVAQGRSRLLWLIGGAVAMGIGIWSMHFTAMLAFRLPTPILYDIPIVVLSLFVAVVASVIALFVASRQRLMWPQLVMGGLIMGVAIAAMHYVGMAAMRLNATLTYNPFLFSLSIIVAITASITALWLAFKFRGTSTLSWNGLKIISAVVMGGAISGMHFIGMHAAIFMPTSEMVGDISNAVNITLLGTGVISFATFMILGLALLLSIIDQRLATQATYLTQTELRHNEVLEELNLELKNRVAGLQLMGEISHTMMSILDTDRLVHEIVNQIGTTFNYYHVHIYLIDNKQENLVIAAGTGPAGAEMLAKGHHIKLNAPASLVARAARNREVVSVDNVREASDWLFNPLLPDTYSEMAVPIILDEQVVGVLDVQENKLAGLDDTDATLLQSLVNQIAVAIRNARLFQEVETALSEAQISQERYIDQTWQKQKVATMGGYYHYSRPNVPTPKPTVVEQVNQLASTHARPIIASVDSSHNNETQSQVIAAPILFQSQNIGVFQLHPTTARQTWTDDDIAVVEAVLDQFAQVAESIRLFDETRERAGRERLIGQISDKLRRAPDIETLMKVGIEELSRALGSKRAFIQLGTSSKPSDGPSDPAAESAHSQLRNGVSSNGRQFVTKNGSGE